MADTPSSILLLRLQSVGSNTNLWGGYLNTAMQTQERASKGYQALAVTGDATISWTNYSASNSGAVAFLKLTGSLSTPAALTFPSYQNDIAVWNATGQSVTIKCSGGTGVTIPNGRKTRIYCDGTDYYSDAPTWTTDSVTLTNSGDYVNYAALSAAIAALTAGSLSGLALYSPTSTVANYIENIVTASATSGLSITKTNGASATEQGAAALDFTRLTVSTNVAAADRFAVYDTTAAAMCYQTRANVVGKYGLVIQASSSTINPIVAGNLYPLDCTAGVGSVTFPASASVGDVFGLIIYGTGGWTVSTNSLNYYGSAYTAFTGTDEGMTFFVYSGASRGWIDA